MDKITPEQRSKNMAAIHSKNTKPEVFFRKQLFNRGYRYSISNKKLPGKPDMHLKKYNTAIFIHGCFWHRHGCSLASEPKSNIEFWNKKFEANVNRDNRVKNEILEKRKKLVIIWECTIRKMKKDEDYCNEIVTNVEEFLRNDEIYLEL